MLEQEETLLFVFFIVELVAIVIYDLISKYLFMLYFMLLASQFAIFYSFIWLLTYPSIPFTQPIKEKLAPLTHFFKACFLFSFIISFVPFIGVDCGRTIYPMAFIMLTGQYMMFTLTTYVFYF